MEPIKIGLNGTYTIDDLVSDILRKKIKKVVVMAGAGISTPSGIPDFRSPGSGLYNNLKEFDIPYPEAIFEISYFRQNPKPFFALAKDLIPNIEKYKPNKIHYFVKLLQEKRLLYRLYTQNIDGLESLAGIDPKKIIEAHGSFRSAKCVCCKTPYSGLYVKNEVMKNKIPQCKYGTCTGIIKPDVVFFGDKLPDNFYQHHEIDFQTADCIIVMGTSLEVEPFANIIRGSHFNAPRLLMNRESVGPFKRKKFDKRKDLQMLGDLIYIVDQFVEKLGWTKDLEALISKEIKNIEENIHSALEKLYFGIYREKNLIRNNLERVSKTSFDQRGKIDSLKRKTAMDIHKKGPIVRNFMRTNDRNFPSKLKPNYSPGLKADDFSKNKKENDEIRALYKEIDTLSLTESISDDEESEIKNSSKTIKPLYENENESQKSNFLKRNYEFQLKLALNFNQIEALETKNKTKICKEDFPKKNNLSIPDEKSNKKTEQNFFHRNSLMTANSRPLLIKRVISAKKL